MPLRLKVTLLLVGVLLVSAVTNYEIQRLAVLPSFRALEHEQAVEDWERCKNALERDEEALSLLCFDWASWDDAYGYVQGKNPGFYEANLANQAWFTDQKIDVLYFCRADGTVHFRHVSKLDSGEPASLAWMPAEGLGAGHPLMKVTADKESHVTGLVRTELGFLLVTSRPILTSKNEGPLAGYLVFGRRVTDETVQTLRAQTGVEFDLADAGSAELSAADRSGIEASLAAAGPVEELVDEDHLAVRGVLKDLKGEPAALIRTAGERNVSTQGRGALRYATGSLAAAGFLTLAVLLVSLRWLVLAPVDALTRYAASVGERGRAGARLDVSRRDELGTLARSMEAMLDQLEKLRAESVAMSRQAGMAEVAAGVLHNVGNAMTNVGVLAETVTTKVSKSRAGGVSKVAALLEQNRGDLPGFFAKGARGEQLPGYLAELSTHLTQELADLQKDLGGLREGLQHVKQIVASHQSIAVASNVMEEADLGELASKALLLVDASLRRHGVTASVEASGSAASCDRSKLSQVLVNLLTNAKEALSGREGAAIRVRTGTQGGRAYVEVSDNGPGVPEENRERVFAKGFTTKPGGHGIGLHHSWLAVREMGGTLTLSSDGGGASFRVELPASVDARRAAA